MELDPRARAWAAGALGARRVDAVRSLAFGTVSDVVLLDADGERVVLRRYLAGWARQLGPDLVEAEALALREAGRTLGAIVPRPLAADPSGAAAGAPALLMSLLPGEARVHDLDLAAAAAALAALHAAPVPPGLPPAQEWLDRTRLAVPDWSRSAPAWAALLELVRGPAASAAEVFLHRDYHPGNLLWQGGALAGIVDGAFACRGAAAVDVAHARTNLALLSGPGSAEAFLAAYRALVPGYRHEARCDAVDLLSFEPGFDGVLALNAFGANLDLALVRARADAYAEALAGGGPPLG